MSAYHTGTMEQRVEWFVGPVGGGGTVINAQQTYGRMQRRVNLPLLTPPFGNQTDCVYFIGTRSNLTLLLYVSLLL